MKKEEYRHAILANMLYDSCGIVYAANFLGVTVERVQELIDGNLLKSWQTPGGQLLIVVDSIIEFLNNNIDYSSFEFPRARLKVMFLEDDPVTQHMFRIFCQNANFPIDFMQTSPALEAVVDMAIIKPHLLIADLNFSGLDGYEVLRMLRGNSQFEKMMILVLSAAGGLEMQGRGDLPKDIVFMTKPVRSHWIQGFFTGFLLGNPEIQ